MRRSYGYTLVEIVVVVMVLGILAGVATGRFFDASDEGRKNTLRASVGIIESIIEIRTASDGGTIPNTIRAVWFASNKVPEHPYNTFGAPSLQRVKVDGLEHPPVVLLNPLSLGAFWYNAANGVIRARVPNQGTREATLALYNQVNNSSLSDLAAVTD